MRWLFACLLFVNILYALWQVQQGHLHRPSVVQTSANDAVASVSPQATAIETLPEAAPGGLCMHLGGLEGDELLAALRQRLLVLGIAADIVEVETLVAEDYLLYQHVQGGRQQVMAELQLLQRAGVDSYLIGEGDLAGRIALGVFASEAAARARQVQLRDMGFAALMEQLARYDREQWLQIGQASSRLLDSAMLQQLRLAFPQLTHHYRPCMANSTS